MEIMRSTISNVNTAFRLMSVDKQGRAVVRETERGKVCIQSAWHQLSICARQIHQIVAAILQTLDHIDAFVASWYDDMCSTCRVQLHGTAPTISSTHCTGVQCRVMQQARTYGA